MASRSQQSSAKATRTFSILAADLKAVGAPTPIAFIHCDPTIVPPLDTTGMAIEQQAMDLHHPVDPFVIGHLAPEGQRLALEDGVDTPVAVSRQLGDLSLISATSLTSGSVADRSTSSVVPVAVQSDLVAGGPITFATVFIGNRPSAATAAAVTVFLTPWHVRALP